ncbi:iron permease FTR1/Fip1/EfeU [Aspergillus minisclerotigenes]|uniref:Iron permease FTR1/Fip1/EfeU n=1 Tax=Aspergillus minisclerotigenes TaxID=656917 RepID=A0A5N6IUL3_9EURO|nr:iron permease FTR1/Fip1/EfeU [Aspergillus minisclerotigenes]
MGNNPVFAVTVFFIVFRECLETTVVVSVLIAFLKQSLEPNDSGDRTIYKSLRKQFVTGVGLARVRIRTIICLAVGGGMIGAFYSLGTDTFANTEYIWEGVLGIISSLIISIMGGALLRVSKIQDKWRVKLAKALQHQAILGESQQSRITTWMEKYAMFVLPFVTALREDLEAVVYVGGVGLGQPATSFPLAVVGGLAAGILVGYIIYRFGRTTSMQVFLVISTGFLYLVAAGLLFRGVWYFEANTWNKVIGGDAAETGTRPGSYDIRQSVWHVNCCSPEIGGGGGWGIFNALLGWTNSATYGSVISYNPYWVCVMICYGIMIYRERAGPIAVIDPAINRVAAYKAKAKATIFRRPVDIEKYPREVVGSVERGKNGGDRGTAVRETEV